MAENPFELVIIKEPFLILGSDRIDMNPSAPKTKEEHHQRGSGDRGVTAGARSSLGSTDGDDMNPRGGYHTPAHPKQSHTRRNTRGARGTAQRSPPEPAHWGLQTRQT